MDDKDSLPTYIEMRPNHFDPHKINSLFRSL